MIKWLKKLLGIDDDEDYDPQLPFGQCEAWLGCHAGMRITCGKRTNHKWIASDLSRSIWHCTAHPVNEDKLGVK